MSYPDDDFDEDEPLADRRAKSAASEGSKARITKQQLQDMMREIASEEIDASVTPTVDYLLKKNAEVQDDPLSDVKRKVADRAVSAGSKSSEFKALVLGFVLIIVMFALTLFAGIDEAMRANYLNSIMELAQWFLGTVGAYIFGRSFVKGKSVGSLGIVGKVLEGMSDKNKYKIE